MKTKEIVLKLLKNEIEIINRTLLNVTKDFNDCDDEVLKEVYKNVLNDLLNKQKELNNAINEVKEVF